MLLLLSVLLHFSAAVPGDVTYANAFCASNAPLCAGHNVADRCDSGDPFWNNFFGCEFGDIVLHTYTVTGNIPTELGLMTLLRDLFLYKPPPDISVPSEIGNLFLLTRLDIGTLGSTLDQLPTEIGNLDALLSLQLFGLDFNGGSVPSQIASLDSISTFSLFDCTNVPQFPPIQAWKDTLHTLFLVGDTFVPSAVMPPLGNSPTIVLYFLISVDNLQFNDPLLFLSPNLANFVVVVGSVTGSIPPTTFYSATSLEGFALVSTDMSATIRPQLSQLSNLVDVTLIDTPNVVGTIPIGIAQLTSLTNLVAQFTGLTGTLPDSFDSLTDLATFTLTGVAIPRTGECDVLTADVLTGTFPHSLFRLLAAGSLTHLEIDHECIGGPIPDFSDPIPNPSATTVFVRNTLAEDPIPNWMVEFMKTHDSSRCDLSFNQFCFWPQDCEGDELQCPFTLDGAVDSCGICNGDNTTCLDCTGIPNGNAHYDLCGDCQGSSDCLDCAGEPFGSRDYDGCGECGGDGSACDADCAGDIGGTAQRDQCGVCNGNNDCLDCFGTPFGTATYDSCDVCGGINGTCVDCNGTMGGNLVIDQCGVCIDVTLPDYPKNSPRNCFDCAGTPNGTAERDVCGYCPASPRCDPSTITLLAFLRKNASWLFWFALGITLMAVVLFCANGALRANTK